MSAFAPTLALRVVAVAVALIVMLVARPMPDPERWRRGAAGEEATAALLGGLGRRWVVFHDRAIPGSRANLDHVAVGPTGVWVIDTKAYRAPLRAGWRSVRAGGHPVDTGASAWEASVVAERLGIDVRAVLAVHGGSGLPARGRRVGGVPVVPASALVGRLRRRRGSARLRRREVAALGEEIDLMFPSVRARQEWRRPDLAPGVARGAGAGSPQPPVRARSAGARGRQG